MLWSFTTFFDSTDSSGLILLLALFNSFGRIQKCSKLDSFYSTTCSICFTICCKHNSSNTHFIVMNKCGNPKDNIYRRKLSMFRLATFVCVTVEVYLLFIVLKLANIIHWSWNAIHIPIWIMVRN